MKPTTLPLWQIIDLHTRQSVGDPGPAQVISDECSRLNDAVNIEGQLRRVRYKVERYRP